MMIPDPEKMMMQKRIDNLCEQLEMLKKKLEEEKTHHQHTLECAQQFEEDWEKMQRERDILRNALIQELGCSVCKHFDDDAEYVSNDCFGCGKNKCNWEYRGLCESNGGAE